MSGVIGKCCNASAEVFGPSKYDTAAPAGSDTAMARSMWEDSLAISATSRLSGVARRIAGDAMAPRDQARMRLLGFYWIWRYWAAAAINCVPATGRCVRRNVRIWRTASGILSGVSFQG